MPTPPSTRRHGAALAAALLGFFIITLDASIVNVALPAMSRELHAGITGLQWVVDGYVLIFAALLLSAGSLSGPRAAPRTAHRRPRRNVTTQSRRPVGGFAAIGYLSST